MLQTDSIVRRKILPRPPRLRPRSRRAILSSFRTASQPPARKTRALLYFSPERPAFSLPRRRPPRLPSGRYEAEFRDPASFRSAPNRAGSKASYAPACKKASSTRKIIVVFQAIGAACRCLGCSIQILSSFVSVRRSSSVNSSAIFSARLVSLIDSRYGLMAILRFTNKRRWGVRPRSRRCSIALLRFAFRHGILMHPQSHGLLLCIIVEFHFLT